MVNDQQPDFGTLSYDGSMTGPIAAGAIVMRSAGPLLPAGWAVTNTEPVVLRISHKILLRTPGACGECNGGVPGAKNTPIAVPPRAEA
jgi:hypothetical protein